MQTLACEQRLIDRAGASAVRFLTEDRMLWSHHSDDWYWLEHGAVLNSNLAIEWGCAFHGQTLGGHHHGMCVWLWLASFISGWCMLEGKRVPYCFFDCALCWSLVKPLVIPAWHHNNGGHHLCVHFVMLFTFLQQLNFFPRLWCLETWKESKTSQMLHSSPSLCAAMSWDSKVFVLTQRWRDASIRIFWKFLIFPIIQDIRTSFILILWTFSVK